MLEQNLRFLFVFLVVGIATATDIYKNKIYNYLTYPAVVLGIGLNVYLSLGNSTNIALAVVLPAAAFAFGLALNKAGLWGGGDVKLVAALTAFAPAYIFQFIFFPFIFLIPASLVQAAVTGGKEAFTEREVHMPSAPFFLMAVLMSLFTTFLVI